MSELPRARLPTNGGSERGGRAGALPTHVVEPPEESGEIGGSEGGEGEHERALDPRGRAAREHEGGERAEGERA